MGRVQQYAARSGLVPVLHGKQPSLTKARRKGSTLFKSVCLMLAGLLVGKWLDWRIFHA